MFEWGIWSTVMPCLGDSHSSQCVVRGKIVRSFCSQSGEGPDPEEVLLAIRVTESKIALKSGFEKYLRVDKDAVVRGISDAVGAMEQWEPVFQV